MDYSELKDALTAHGRTMRDVETAATAVWAALVKAEPELAAEVLQLFSTVEAAASWATSSSGGPDGSPAQHVAEGRAPEVLSRVRKTAHGFVG